ncbi:MAG TPA: hypothetical protein VFL81_00075 [Candidatus Saccharimonadales bacterium]|nr:hypothetical protein [Candidatus Saccharimonadales bacterium]
MMAGLMISSLAPAWLPQTVSALGYNYFDDAGGTPGSCDVRNKGNTNDICSSVRVRLAVGETRYVRKTNVHVRAYFKQRRGNIAIYHINLCPGNGGDQLQSGDYFARNGIPYGTKATEYRIGNQTVYGYFRKASAASCDANQQIILNNNDFVYKDGLYYVDINVTPVPQGNGGCPGAGGSLGGCDGVMNMFYLKESSGSGLSPDGSTDYYIAQVGDNTSAPNRGFKTTVEQIDSSPTNLTYVARFGADCSVTSAQSADLVYYDMDNDGGSGAQLNGKVRMQLKRIAANGNVSWSSWTPGTTDNATQTHSFTARPGDRYEWFIENVYYNNTMQFSTPFDGIYYITPCPSGNVRPHTSLSPSGLVTVGQQVKTVNTYVHNGGRYDTKVGITRRLWIDNNNNSTFEAGTDQQLEHIYRSDDVYRYIDAQSDNTNFGTWSYTPKNGDKRICTELGVYELPDHSINIAGSPAVDCVEVGKFPTMQVRGGDLRTGGRYPAGLSQCAETIPLSQRGGNAFANNKVYGHYFNSPTDGSYAEYGVISAGNVVGFGSNGIAPYGSGSLYRDMLFGRYSNWRDGYFFSTGAGDARSTPVPTYCFPDVYNDFPNPVLAPVAIAGGANVTITSLGSGPTVDGVKVNSYHFSGNNGTLTIDDSGLNASSWRALRVSQNAGATGNRVIIAHDIAYNTSTTHNGIASLPEFALLAEGDIDIQVRNGVEKLYGIYATGGDFLTCGSFAGGNSNSLGTGSACDNRLTVYGTVIAQNNLYPYRTYGDSNSPAEVFRLIPEINLSDYARQTKNSTNVRTTSQEELPPRF